MAEHSYGRIEIFDGCCVTGNVVGAGSGEIVQWGGKVYGKYSGVDNSVRLGRYASHRGFYYMAGGEFGCGGAMSVGRTGKAHGELWQTGGTVKPNTDVIIGDTEGATGVVHVVGGEMRPNSGCVRYAEFIFDGGTLRATSDSATYVSNLTSFAVGTGGGKVDTDDHNVTFAHPFAATELNSDLAHRWSFNGDYVDSVTGETAPDNMGGTFFTEDKGGKNENTNKADGAPPRCGAFIRTRIRYRCRLGGKCSMERQHHKRQFERRRKLGRWRGTCCGRHARLLSRHFR